MPRDAAQTVINSVPFVINASGKYVLGNNLIVSSANLRAITITAPNVILDLNEFFVSGPGNTPTSDQAVISVSNVSDVTVRNGTVANNGTGISFAGGSSSIDHPIENVRITRCYNYGIRFNGSTASPLVRNCTISQIGGFTGGTSSSPSAFGIFVLAGVRIENNAINNVTGSDTRGTPGQGFGIVQTAGSFSLNNTIVDSANGIAGGSKYRDKSTSGCTTPFSGGISLGGNN